MSNISSIHGNPVVDAKAIHYPESSGSIVYPSEKSNLVIGPDGSVEYGSADEPVVVKYKNVFWTGKKLNESTGAVTNAAGISHTFLSIPKDADRIYTLDTDHVQSLELLAWTSEGAYVGVWSGSAFGSSESWFTEIDIKAVVASYPTHVFRLNAKRPTADDAMAIWQYVGYEYKRNAYVDSKFDDIENGILFDSSAITVMDGSITGSNGAYNSTMSDYVSTDFVDVSGRIGSRVSFYSTILANPYGCAVYDRGKNYLFGLWGNMSNLASLGYVSNEIPQKVTLDLPENAYYIRAMMSKTYYSAPADFGFRFYDTKSQKVNVDYDRNFLTIAHKGYGGSGLANSLQSFVNAAEAGFRAVEIDCRKTSDGVYVASHNDTLTLYSSGTGASYTISTSAWSSLKGKTIDSTGLYPIATLASIFNTLKRYKIDYFVIDLKAGTTDEIMELARRCGVAGQIMLSYYTAQSFMDDIDTLKKYPDVAIRFTPLLTKTQFDTIRAAIHNPLFADINVYEGGYGTYIPNALSYHVPILCAGVADSSKDRMAPIASGAMSNLTLQYSPKDFIDMISLDFSKLPTLTPDANSVNVAVGNNTTVNVSTSIDEPACWAFGYSSDLGVFSVQQTAFSASAAFKITGVNAGSGYLIVFTATGEQVNIPVTVT